MCDITNAAVCASLVHSRIDRWTAPLDGANGRHDRLSRSLCSVSDRAETQE